MASHQNIGCFVGIKKVPPTSGMRCNKNDLRLAPFDHARLRRCMNSAFNGPRHHGLGPILPSKYVARRHPGQLGQLDQTAGDLPRLVGWHPMELKINLDVAISPAGGGVICKAWGKGSTAVFKKALQVARDWY